MGWISRGGIQVSTRGVEVVVVVVGIKAMMLFTYIWIPFFGFGRCLHFFCRESRDEGSSCVLYMYITCTVCAVYKMYED